MAKILAVANQKGGVGKTFLVFHLAHFLAEKGRRSLAVDLDPQGNLSLAFLLPRGLEPTCKVSEVFSRERLEVEEIGPHLFLAPSDIRLARHEASSGGVAVYFKLKRALERFLQEVELDFVLIDCPPSLGLFSLSAFVAANAVLVPMRPEMFSVSGLGDLLQVLEEVRENINPHFRILGVVLNAVQERTRVARQTISELSASVELPILASLPHSIKAEMALREGQPVWRIAPESPLSKALREGFMNIYHKLSSLP